jgi:hypothetical protein
MVRTGVVAPMRLCSRLVIAHPLSPPAGCRKEKAGFVPAFTIFQLVNSLGEMVSS